MFQLKFETLFEKTFLKLDRQAQRDVLKYFNNEALLKDPKKFAKPLQYGKKGNWRFRIGDYRVICKIIDKELIILALDVGHRSDVYKV
jgi:mRNA interferase RelE/StbE